MDNLPVKISVVIPVYNVEKYLSTCLCSCINQTLYDIEIICVNDGSTDNSIHILQEFAKRDNRIKIVDKSNGGLSSARNAGIRRSCGKFIMFLDSDDYLAYNACERVWIETLEAPTDVVIFGTNIFPEKPRATNWHYNVLKVYTHRYYKFSASALFSEPSAKPFVWRQAYKRRFLEQHGLEFDERVKYGEDIVFQMEAFPHGKRFAFISDKLYFYRWHREGSLMQNYEADIDEKIQRHLYFIEFITEYWKSQDWFILYGKEYVQWLLEFTVPDIRRPDVQNSAEHLKNLNVLIQKYNLEKYLMHMPRTVNKLVKTVRKGIV